MLLHSSNSPLFFRFISTVFYAAIYIYFYVAINIYTFYLSVSRSGKDLVVNILSSLSDLIVGAPYGGTDGKGAIFIYHGSANGLGNNYQPVQVNISIVYCYFMI